MSKRQVSKQAIPGKLRSLYDRAIEANTSYEATHNLANLDQALALLNQIIHHPTFAKTPKEFQAGLLGTMAVALYDHFKHMGDGSNLDQAILYYNQALEVFTRQADPSNWANTMMNLGNAYSERIHEDRAENLEQAILCYNQALEIRTRQAAPGEWAGTMNSLGNAYRERIRGDAAENLEQAILYYNQALEVRTRQAAPMNWAMTMMGLGSAYYFRICGDKAENLEQASKCYEQALEVRTRQADPGKWAMTMMGLGNVYSERIRGDTAENLEQAILYYKQAQEVCTRQTAPGKWVRTVGNLGSAYLYRIRGDKAENLEQAILYYKQALEVFTRQAAPEDWAMVMMNLGTTYLSRIRGDKAENLEQAILYYKQALEANTRQTNPREWAKVMLNRGNAYLFRIRGDADENQEQAIKCYKQALEVLTRQADPILWAKLMNNLGNAYRNRIYGDADENQDQAIKCLEQALEIQTPTNYPQNCLDTAANLGSILYYLWRFTEARKYLEMAHEAIQNLRKEVKRHEGKQELSVENADLYAQLVACCLHDDPKDVEAAFTYAVAGKGRAFVDALASPRLTPGDAAKDNPELAADWATAQQLWQELENIRARLTRDSESGTGQELTQEVIAQLNQDLEQRQAKEREHWETMTFKYPALTATLQAPALSAADAKALASACQATLVEYYRHAEGWAAFVVTPTAIRYIPLEIPDELLEELQKWFDLIERVNNSKLKGTLVNRPEVLDTLSDLYKAIITPLGIEAGTSLIIAPFTQLHRFPLAAARNPDEQYLIDLYPLAFVPSLGALKVIKAQRERDQKQREARPSAPEPTLLSVAYPGEQGSKSYLDSAIPEAQAIMALFSQAKALHEAQATPNEVIKQAQAYDLLHFGCHGNFNSANPAQSGLLLADGKWLTVQQIITEMRLGQTALVTLGACESGLAAGNEGDELVGLVQGFLLAGPPAVVGSLWKVSDTSTKELFTTFYKALKDGKAPSQAMLEAVKWVRRESKWAHPYYWAAFQAYGLALGN